MQENKYSKIYVALPAMNEFQYLPALIKSIKKQDFADFELFVCVNQPDQWWEKDERYQQCVNNVDTIEYLSEIKDLPISIIDRSSKGKGWEGKSHGVGWARKTVMDEINTVAAPDDLIISLDADTVFKPAYFSSLIQSFNQYPEAAVMAVPYYHPLTDDSEANRAMLRYEIYMRNYNINLWRINSPYAFTALGSALALPVWAYRAISGMTPKKSGEDFYFLQKLRKFGKVLVWNEEKVYPGTRFSDRVFFGTGPAMIKGNAGDWDSYPIYHYSLFDNIKATYELFDMLFDDIQLDTPMNAFLKDVFREDNIWEPLRNNSKTREQFTRACHYKLDGLRILQYLKSAQAELGKSDEDCLKDNYTQLMPEINFDDTEGLSRIRDLLVDLEEKYQQSTIIH